MFVCLVLRVRLIASSLFWEVRVSGGEKHGRVSDDYLRFQLYHLNTTPCLQEASPHREHI